VVGSVVAVTTDVASDVVVSMVLDDGAGEVIRNSEARPSP
jgi:hypothetical protein